MYVLGFIALIGVVSGRFVCGWICPFGLIQELLHKIPGRKLRPPAKVNNCLKWLKYAVLLLAVIILPIALTDQFGLSTPFFCKYICPAGTLQGGVPLLLLNEPLRGAIGFLFSWKMGILVVVIIASILIYRPFCRYLCPLGALYSLFNPISFYRHKVDESKCTHCGKCAEVCEMDVDASQSPNSLECIRCRKCIKTCPAKAIKTVTRKEAPTPAPAPTETQSPS
jgi:polyferredoxin